MAVAVAGGALQTARACLLACSLACFTPAWLAVPVEGSTPGALGSLAGCWRQLACLEDLSSRSPNLSPLQAHPDFRQAQTLLDAAESEVIKDGLVGVGAGAAVLGAVIGIVAAVARKR